MTRIALTVGLALVLGGAGQAGAAEDELAALRREFARRTGAELVFVEKELPRGSWFDRMDPLARGRQLGAARILVEQAGRYPEGWLGRLGLERVGVFAALVAERGDGFRPYDEVRKGYLYYGMWNGEDAIAAAYYSDEQLPLTFHHEAFHHIDGHGGSREDDARFSAAIAGTARYPALAIDGADLAALAKRAGAPLRDAVGGYAAKSAGEDQAETARWLQANLSTALWQAAARPELAGSQRILHVLAEYQAAGGPGPAWWIEIALGRDPAHTSVSADVRFIRESDAGYRQLTERLAPRGELVVWGRAGDDGNATLRADIARFGSVALQLGEVARRYRAPAAERARAGARLTALLERYRAHIASNWPMSARTAAAFAAARAKIELALPAPAPDNPYLDKVDAAIADPRWRAAIRAVQPATVKLGGGSGVNLDPAGLVLTAAHVVDEVGRKVTVRFPDGRSFRGVCTHLDAATDLALVRLEGAAGLPIARLAAAAPATGDDVAIVGQPGVRTPDGGATGYQPWHVSTGEIRGFRRGDRAGDQHLGRTKHDAWTYWGHSGSPLFDRAGAVVALHNSWDSKTAMRHAVTWEAMVAFLASGRGRPAAERPSERTRAVSTPSAAERPNLLR